MFLYVTNKSPNTGVIVKVMLMSLVYKCTKTIFQKTKFLGGLSVMLTLYVLQSNTLVNKHFGMLRT